MLTMWTLLLLVACARWELVPIFADTGPRVREAFTTEVGCVIDGDTFEIDGCGGETIRLYGADTPEVYTDDGVPECYAEIASDFTKGVLTPGTEVRLTFDVCTTDPYGRTLAYAWVGAEDSGEEPLFLNDELIRRGYARLFRDDVGCATDIQYFELFEQLETSAKASGAGLWGACEP